VNLFVAGWSDGGRVDPERARRALADFVAALPFFPRAEVRVWAADGLALAWVSHPPERVGGVPYVEVGEGGFSLFSGRPVEDEGRFVRVRGEGGRLEVRTDPLGAYPVYTAEADGARWVSGHAEPLRALLGDRRVGLDALAGLLGGGWPLGGRPLWAAVRRLEPPSPELVGLLGRGLDAAAAAETLVAWVGALADWPGRPSVVPVTGGRDSRLVLAAARAAGFDFEAVTGGAPDSPDVVAAAALCAAAGVPHRRLGAAPGGDVFSQPREMARVLGLLSAGTASLADAAGFPLAPTEGPLELWHSGQGGEVARAYYRAAATGRGGLVDGLERLYCGRRPGRAEPLSDDGRARVRRGIERFVAGQREAGAEAVDVPDLFYLRERMGSWAGPTHGAVEPVRDTTSPLWSVRMLPFELGLPAPERAREGFHRAVLRELAPDLLEVPFAGGAGWKTPSRVARARRLARRAAEEARRRVARPRPAAAEAGPDPFARVQEAVRREAAAQPGHVAWQVLDRDRVERLLARGDLDTMSRYYVWRLATVFLDPGLREAEPA
jgi:hypothetical protein